VFCDLFSFYSETKKTTTVAKKSKKKISKTPIASPAVAITSTPGRSQLPAAPTEQLNRQLPLLFYIAAWVLVILGAVAVLVIFYCCYACFKKKQMRDRIGLIYCRLLRRHRRHRHSHRLRLACHIRRQSTFALLLHTLQREAHFVIDRAATREIATSLVATRILAIALAATIRDQLIRAQGCHQVPRCHQSVRVVF
jgi:hypothetical protein